jgi:GST-like protein
MIDLYFWPTPNGLKITVALEELGLPYTIKPVNIGQGDQFKPEYLAISPNNKMPAIVDHAPTAGGARQAIFESGAILLYLAEKTGRLMPSDPRDRIAALEWLFWQVGGLGPMLGQLGHFKAFAKEKIPYAIDRYTTETERLYGVLDKRLADHPFLAGAELSIADCATLPWAAGYERLGLDITQYPNVGRWIADLKARPAIAKGLAIEP